MFVKIQLSSNLPIGTVLEFDAANNVWNTALNNSNLFGILETTEQDEDSLWWGQVRFGNTTRALADRDIPDEGGFLSVVNGRVFVDNTTDNKCGVIAPLARGQATRTAGNLVMVYLR